MLPYDKQLKPLSQQLRKHMTDAENLLWSKLRRKQLKGYQFYRQKTIGKYIVDFYWPKAHLLIELDGGQHYTSEGIKEDRIRDTKAVISKATFLSLSVIAACPQSFWFFQKDSRLAGMTSM